MPRSYTLGKHYEAFVQAQLASGRLDAVIARGRADIDAGRVHDLDEVCDALDAELATAATDQPER
ncbi:hypothetical protein [Azospirillum sp.]|uniref:hypothetical protein n=1 Tax=Azospirillum sp. TaxID=34012 RepID=UPI002D401A46|nr:hypothetical protein [Azospirillum sp.]HYD70864.1 hypothetical protein [Azospirillum sp.]